MTHRLIINNEMMRIHVYNTFQEAFFWFQKLIFSLIMKFDAADKEMVKIASLYSNS